MTDSSTIIHINRLCFSYDSREILHDVTLSITDGMFAAMVGPNGGGKTTLLKLILGLLPPLHGTVSVFGTTPVCARKRIGYVPQAILYDPAFPASVMDVVLMGRVDRHPFGFFRKKDRETAMQCLEAVHLSHLAQSSFSEISGGQRQRVLIAQALASEPDLLLLDEPAANLDQENTTTLFELLRDLNAQKTILMVSHNLSIVSQYVSHVICVNQTVDMHPIEQVQTLAADPMGWIHLVHQSCPVSTGKMTDEQMHPHSHHND